MSQSGLLNMPLVDFTNILLHPVRRRLPSAVNQTREKCSNRRQHNNQSENEDQVANCCWKKEDKSLEKKVVGLTSEWKIQQRGRHFKRGSLGK